MTVAKSRGTDGSLLPSLPWTLASLALALGPHIPYMPIWITGAFMACAAWRYSIERRRAPLPSAWFRAFLALVCFLGVLYEYETISGVGPGSALLAIMASLKLLETRKRRDQFVLLFIAIFLVMSALLREQYLWVAALPRRRAVLHHDSLVADVGRTQRIHSPQFCNRRSSAHVRGTIGDRYVGFLPTYCNTILGRTHRYEQRRLGTE